MVKHPCIIVQARMNSERLPGKVMRPLGGRPLIGILLERLQQSGLPLLLASSVHPENDILIDYVRSLGVQTFRGSEENVLERYYLAAQSCGADVVIRATGDNPLMDGKLIADAYQRYLELDNERCYLSIGMSKTFPLGISASVFSFALLEEAYRNASLPGHFEHVTPYISTNVPGNIDLQLFASPKDRFAWRLTVDTERDFELHRILIEQYACDRLGIDEIIQVLDAHPELAAINSDVVQKSWDQ
ncbi:MAG: glycosyltransferase family protein [Bacteroidales bacterium]|nr:glycosyltransferase family protein [Bacteroidales bacterium]